MLSDRQMAFLLSALVSISQLAMVIYLPSLPQISIDLHTTPQLTELTITLFLLTFGLSQLIYGPLSDHFGRKPIILIGIFSYSIFSLISALAPTIQILLLARCCEGLGAGAITALARATINDLFTGKQLTKALSHSAVAASLATMLSPSIGGWFTVAFNWRANFYFLTIYALVFFLLALFLLPNLRPQKNSEISILRLTFHRYHQICTNYSYLFFMAAGCISASAIMGYYSASPFIFQHILKLSPKTYGYLFLLTSGCFISGSFLNGWLYEHETKRLRSAGYGLIFASMLMLVPALFGKISVPLLVIPMMFYLFCMGIIFPTTMTCAVRSLKSIAGTAAAVMGCCQILGSSITTAIMAHLPQNNQIALAWLLLIWALISYLLIYLALHQSKFQNLNISSQAPIN